MVDVTTAHAVALVLTAIADPGEDVVTLVDDKMQASWRRRLRHLGRTFDPHGYADPALVSYRLVAATARRQRLALDEQHRATVQSVLALYNHEIARDAASVVALVHVSLRQDPA